MPSVVIDVSNCAEPRPTVKLTYMGRFERVYTSSHVSYGFFASKIITKIKVCRGDIEHELPLVPVPMFLKPWTYVPDDCAVGGIGNITYATSTRFPLTNTLFVRIA